MERARIEQEKGQQGGKWEERARNQKALLVVSQAPAPEGKRIRQMRESGAGSELLRFAGLVPSCRDSTEQSRSIPGWILAGCCSDGELPTK